MTGSTILLYTSGTKPFVQRFFDEHYCQSKRVNFNFTCIASNAWNSENSVVILQRKPQSSVMYTGIFEAILQGIESLPDDQVVFFAEDDCLYHESRYADEFVSLSLQEPGRLYYQTNVSFICPAGFYKPTISGICLHSAFGTVAAIRHNIQHKLAEYNGETEFPITSVEPVSYPTPENPDPAFAIYRTRCIQTTIPVSLDFRGYGVQSWQPDGSEPTWQTDDIWGESKSLWHHMIES